MSYTTRPSSLPAQAKSPKYEPNPTPTTATEAGTDRHLALAELLTGTKRDVYSLLQEVDRSAVDWAAEYIRGIAGDQEILSETPVEVRRGGNVVLRGTADVIVGSHIVDLKWVERNYGEQQAAYALGAMQKLGLESMQVHLLFGEPRRVVSYTLTRSEAEALVYPVLDAVADPNVECRISEYCGWCKHSAYCKVRLKEINKIADGYDLVRVEDLSVTSPEDLARALNLAKVASDWAEEVRAYCGQAAKDGLQIPGWTLKARAGGREIAPDHINEAFSRIGLPSEQFIKACKLSITGLSDALQETGLTKREADARINERLSGLIRHKPASQYLAKA